VRAKGRSNIDLSKGKSRNPQQLGYFPGNESFDFGVSIILYMFMGLGLPLRLCGFCLAVFTVCLAENSGVFDGQKD
jgi:hypothetical protein